MPPRSTATDCPSVDIEDGSLSGLCLANDTRAFLGIPFADTVQRFKKPAPALLSNKVQQADTLPPACLQQFSFPEAYRNITE